MRLSLWAPVGFALSCAGTPTGQVALRLHAAAGPSPLATSHSLRVTVVGGETVEVPIEQAFLEGVSVAIDATDMDSQVEVLALAADGGLIGRGISAPVTLVEGMVTPIDIVLRPADAFSGGIDALPDPRPRAQVAGSTGGSTWVVGGAAALGVPDRVDVIEPWLTTVIGRSVVDEVAAIHDDDPMWTAPVALVGTSGRLALVSDLRGFSVDAALGPSEPITVVGDRVAPGATALALGANNWLLVGGDDEGGAVNEVTVANWPVSTVMITDQVGTLAVARRHPIVALAGSSVVVIGGASSKDYGEILGEGTFKGPAALPTDGIAWGAASAVFCGDGSMNIYAWSGDAFGVAGRLDAPRAGAALALLDDASLLVVGGGDAAISGTAARFAIGSDGQFSLIASIPMLDARTDGVVVRLSTSAFMAVGGLDPSGAPVGALNVFQPR